ncbi:(Na+)-NQR maturation NqrM [Saccharophagus sp. K07]|jgi:hypothetical protein|uniref:(Na+)-NQR maturation NqrM n=1 Tax=Saccharophagus sp. K07 TaxID=2283636 RepID=UPI001652B666|nr:(Na+)-NQR maturation NqrM [Saccharophagus sp. K07]MBC6904726.1 (Na+)-NQR maturation NqrM [Saccharophagus sp. K07]
MTTIFLTFVILLLIVAGMAVGVIFRGKPIKGTCGGIASLGMGQACEICGGDKNKCEKESGSAAAEPAPKKNLAYNAAEK